MRIGDCIPQSTQNTPTDGNIVQVEATSLNTASVSPIVIIHSDTDVTRIVLEPVLVDNSHDSSKSVSFKLVYEKRKKGDDYPTEKVTSRCVKAGEVMEMTFDTTATQSLFQNLATLYEMYNANGIPFGQATYARIDSAFRNFLGIMQNDPSAARMIGNQENFALVKELLRLITQSDSLDSLSNALKNLQGESISSLSDSVSCERLNRAIDLIQGNMNNSKEEFWQTEAFAEHQWVLSQLFSSPCTIFQDKAYVGGKSISNSRGNVCDFLYQNKLSGNVVLIEIKTPATCIIHSSYRDTYSFTCEMSGAVNQVINYRDKLMKEYDRLFMTSAQPFTAFMPKCVVIIGKLSEMGPGEKAAFENYRNSLSNVEIVTFDEVLQRLIDLRDIFADESPAEEESDPFDFPF